MVDQRREEGETRVEAQGGVMDVAEAQEQHGEKVEGRTQREIIWKRFRRHKLAVAGGIILVLIYVAALLAPWIAPYDYRAQDFTAMRQAPSLAHPMGTDQLGRDMLTRVMYGGRVSMSVGVGVGLIVVVVGGTLAIISGYYGRFVDNGLMGATDFILILPFIPFLAVMGSIFSFTAVTITLVLGALVWPRMARLIRGEVLSIRDQEYVQAAKAVGVSDIKIMWRHIFPNTVGVMVVEATLIVAIAIIAESSLSYLGLGIQPPTPSWGNMLEDARTTMTTSPWLTWFPGMMIVITALCVNFLGDGLRDALDPKAMR